MKKCTACQQEKPLGEFFKDKGFSDGYYSKCKVCKTAATLEWRAKNKDVYNAKMREYQAAHKDKRRDCDLKRTYGVEYGWYETTLAAQNNVCRICKKPNPSKNRTFVLDHDHKTGQPRGLLCYGCNRALHVLETADLLQSAMDYLKFFKEKSVK